MGTGPLPLQGGGTHSQLGTGSLLLQGNGEAARAMKACCDSQSCPVAFREHRTARWACRALSTCPPGGAGVAASRRGRHFWRRRRRSRAAALSDASTAVSRQGLSYNGCEQMSIAISAPGNYDYNYEYRCPIAIMMAGMRHCVIKCDVITAKTK